MRFFQVNGTSRNLLYYKQIIFFIKKIIALMQKPMRLKPYWYSIKLISTIRRNWWRCVP